MRKRIALLPLFSGSDANLRFFQLLSLAALLYVALAPAENLNFTVCLFYNITQLPCPGCGLSRAVKSAFQLELDRAFGFHPLGIFAAPAVLFFAASALLAPVAGLYHRFNRLIIRLMIIGAVTAILFGLARIAWILIAPESAGRFFQQF